MIDDSVVILAGGDILKRDEILWNFTFEEIIPYLKFKLKDVSFRDGVRHFIGIKDSLEEGQVSASYCRACKRAGKNNCSECPKIFEVIDGNK